MAGEQHIVQFSGPIHYAKEGEDSFTVDVMRLGSLQGQVSVRLRTEDGSARDGVHYHAIETTLIFQDGQANYSVEVPIVEDERWAPTVEFKLVLDRPSGCNLGAYLYECRVKVFTDDTFPSNKYKEQIVLGPDAIQEINGLMLFFEFFKYNLFCPGMVWRTLLTLALDQLANLYLFFTLYAKTYLVNNVLSDKVDADELIIPNKDTCAIAIGITYVVPLAFIHLWQYRKLTVDIEGRTKALLQAYLFRKYLNYNERSRDSVKPVDVNVAIMSKCKDVAAAYTAVLEVLQMLGRLLLLTIFTLTHEPSSWWVLIAMPTLMFVFGYCRSDALSKAGESSGPLKKALIELVNEACEKYNLIAEYARRPQMNELFERRVHQVRQSVIPEAQVESNNKFFPEFLGPLFIGTYIALWAPSVHSGATTLGAFIAMISVFGDVSGDFSGIYDNIMIINTRLDSMTDLTILFNKPTDLALGKEVDGTRQELQKHYRAQAMAQPQPPPDTGLLRTDMMPITLTGVCFGYSKDKYIFKDVDLRVSQGKLVAVVSGHGEGLGTFLKLLGHNIFPSRGVIFIPTHLRILYVAQQPVLLDASLWKNLTFGNPRLEEHSADDQAHVRKIMNALSMDKCIPILDARGTQRHIPLDVSMVRFNSREAGRFVQVSREPELKGFISGSDSDSDDNLSHRGCCAASAHNDEAEAIADTSWFKALSYTDRVKVSLARALLMNPEVLILHRPLHHFSVEKGMEIMLQIKEHHKNRGLGMPETTRNSRRPRSVFFSPESTDEAKQADVIWQVGRGTVYEEKKYKLSKDLKPEFLN